MMVFAIITILLGLLWKPLFFIGLVLTAWCAYFFRDPVRITPTRPGLVISPADGVVQSIEKATPPEELQMGPDQLVRVAVFMNVFDVHINRAPVSATVGLRHYTPGKFLNASLDKASVDNERISWRFDLDDGRKLAAIQIAGLVARRILPFAEKDERLRVGERFGMIRFGSRVDIYLPQGVNPLVAVGQRAIAGETVLADLDPPAGQQEAARQAIAQ